MFSGSEILQMWVITASSAVPITLLVAWLTFRLMLRRNIKRLPALLEDPELAFSAEKAVAKVQSMVSDDFTNAMVKGMSVRLNDKLNKSLKKYLMREVQKEMTQQVMKVVEARLDVAGKKLTNTMVGALGGYTNTLKAQLVGAPDPKTGKPTAGAFTQAGELLKMVPQLKEQLSTLTGGSTPKSPNRSGGDFYH